VDTAEFVRSNTFYSRGAGLGYLKPIIQADLLRKASCRYDETLTIGEDYDFIFRLLVAGLKYRVLPRQLYYYRKHGGSISHRLSSKAARAMLDAEQRFLPQLTGTNPEILAAVEGRRKSLETVLVFNSLIAALKSRRLAESAGRILRCPRLLPLLREPLQAWFSRFRAKLLSLAAAGSYSPRKTAQ
jgi:succinoglycan biosynthesis protein ExoO